MGVEAELFCGEVSEDLKCSICLEVYSSPVMLSCKHVFCAECINKWISKCSATPTCPHDRLKIGRFGIRSAPKHLIRQINQLKVRCEFGARGCDSCVKYIELKEHHLNCPYNPKNSGKLNKWFKRNSMCKIKSNDISDYIYLTTMPSLYSFSYSKIAHGY